MNRDELHELLAALVDGRLDPAAAVRLHALLSGDAEARTLYRRYCALHADLAVSLEGGARPQPTPAPTSSRRPSWRGQAAWALAGAVAATILIGVGLFARQLVHPPAPSVGEVAHAEDAAWDQPSPPAVGTKVWAVPHALTAGMLRLRLVNGVEVTLHAPAALDLRHAGHAILERGRASVRVVDATVGFRIDTPTAEVIDLGTEFGVAVEPGGASEVHVFEGVVVARRRGSNLVVPLQQNEAGRIEGEQGDIASVRLDPRRFARAVGLPRPDPIRPAGAHPPLPPGSRVMFLGDRVTDRETHLLLIAEALERKLGPAAPALFNAAVSVPLSFPEAAAEKYLLPHRPTHAVVGHGVQHAVSDRPPTAEAFAGRLTRLVESLGRRGITPILVTNYPLPLRYAAAQPLLDQYNRAIRNLAAERGLRLADAEAGFRAAGPGVPPLTSNADYVPTFAGCRVLAAVILEAMGFSDAPVADALRLGLLPGVLCDWQIRVKPATQRLDAEQVRLLSDRIVRPTDEAWTRLTLPQDDPLTRRLPIPSHSISYQDRQRGFATHLHFHKDQDIEGVAVIESDGEREVVFNTGATLFSIWLNGEKVFDQRTWTGWHAGKERIPARLKAGPNTIVIEAHDCFFLSVTDGADWPIRGGRE